MADGQYDWTIAPIERESKKSLGTIVAEAAITKFGHAAVHGTVAYIGLRESLGIKSAPIEPFLLAGTLVGIVCTVMEVYKKLDAQNNQSPANPDLTYRSDS